MPLLVSHWAPTTVTRTVGISLLLLRALQILEGSRKPPDTQDMVYFVMWLESRYLCLSSPSSLSCGALAGSHPALRWCSAETPIIPLPVFSASLSAC